MDGTLHEIISQMLNGILGGNTAAALGIYTVICWIIAAFIRQILKIIPTQLCGPISFILWGIAKLLFGSEVILNNNNNQQFVASELQKKYPNLTIKAETEKKIF